MPLLLSIETATGICSVCLHEGNTILSLQEIHRENSHVETITLLIRQALEESGKTMKQLDAVAVSAGPGSYTGLRVGTSTAKGISYGLDIPMIAIPTLEYLAQSVSTGVDSGSLIVPMIDARRMEVYTAFYLSDMKEYKELHNLILEEDSFIEMAGQFEKIVFLGNGAEKAKDLYSGPIFRFIEKMCSAGYMVELVEQAYRKKNFVDKAYFAPLYYKSPNITTSKKAL